jgi:aryl-alcohol dehydrogenase-like predicted oxidoreductase
LADAKHSGLGVIVKEALANGRLTDRSAAETPGLKSFADAHQTSADVVAIAAALASPFVDVVLSGAVTIDQLESNLRAIDLVRVVSYWPKIAQNADEYWTQRKRLAWQ